MRGHRLVSDQDLPIRMRCVPDQLGIWSILSGNALSRHLTSHDFRRAASQALKHVLSREDSYNCVIALPPSGLLGGYWKVVNETRDATIVVLRDTAENILGRITFYDIDSRRVPMSLTDREKGLYLREIRRDIATSAAPSPGRMYPSTSPAVAPTRRRARLGTL